MKSYVITLFGLEYSENLASRCIYSGMRYRFPISFFSAVNKYMAIKEMQNLGLSLNKNYYSRVADEAIGDRGVIPCGEWVMSTAELGCVLSHYKLWEKAIVRNENIIVFEHDAEIISPIPKLPNQYEVANFDLSPWPGAGAYIISPEGAKCLIEEVDKNGLQPSDELLWRTVFRDKKVFKPRKQVINVAKEGYSTIQWSRTDETHEGIIKEDVWKNFEGLRPTNKKYFNSKGSAQKYKKTISLPVYNRPFYLARTLNSLSALNTDDYKLYVNIEPECDASLELIKQIDFIEIDYQVNNEKLGVRANPYNLIQRVFASGSEWNFHIEDDLVFSPDVIQLIDWYFENQIDDVLIYGTCNRTKMTDDIFDCRVFKNFDGFSGLGWCVNKINWEKHLRTLWFEDSGKKAIKQGGWDWSLSRYIFESNFAELIPVLSRTTTIGEIGTYSTKASHAAFFELPMSRCESPKYVLQSYDS